MTGAMELRQHNVALTWRNALSLLLSPILAAIVIVLIMRVASVSTVTSLAAFVVLCVLLGWFLYGGVRPFVWWWGAEFRVEDGGLFFGQDHRRSRPSQIAFAARNPYRAPWDAASNFRVVRSARAVRQMRALTKGRGANAQPTAYLGYFPIPGRAALVFDVMPDQVEIPEIRMPTQSLVRLEVSEPERGAQTWALPVRDVSGVVEALRARGIVVGETTEAQRPVPNPYSPALSVGTLDETITRRLTESLGRPPTDDEVKRIRDDVRRNGA